MVPSNCEESGTPVEEAFSHRCLYRGCHCQCCDGRVRLFRGRGCNPHKVRGHGRRCDEPHREQGRSAHFAAANDACHVCEPGGQRVVPGIQGLFRRTRHRKPVRRACAAWAIWGWRRPGRRRGSTRRLPRCMGAGHPIFPAKSDGDWRTPVLLFEVNGQTSANGVGYDMFCRSAAPRSHHGRH